MTYDINLFAVLVAAIGSFVAGCVWYSPLLFGKSWMKFMGLTKEQMAESKKKGMAKLYLGGLVIDLVTAYVLAHFIQLAKVTDFVSLRPLVGWLWLGFMAPIMFGSILWEKKPFKLFLINALYRLVSLGVMGYILLAI